MPFEPVVVGVAVDGILSVGREAISVPALIRPVNDDVPPGRYWPGGESMRTVDVATAPAPDGAVFDCGPTGAVAAGAVTVGLTGGCVACVTLADGAACVADAAEGASA